MNSHLEGGASAATPNGRMSKATRYWTKMMMMTIMLVSSHIELKSPCRPGILLKSGTSEERPEEKTCSLSRKIRFERMTGIDKGGDLNSKSRVLGRRAVE